MKYKQLSFILAILLVLSALFNLYQWQKFNNLENEYTDLLQSINKISYKVSLLISFGNGTRIWFNNTRIPIGWSLFNLTYYLTEGNMQFTATQWGPFITSILSVSQYDNRYWLWYYWDPSAHEWLPGEVGAADYYLKDSDIIAWCLCEWGETP